MSDFEDQFYAEQQYADEKAEQLEAVTAERDRLKEALEKALERNGLAPAAIESVLKDAAS